MSNFNHIPDDTIPLPSGSGIDRVCQTCAHCTWIGMNACKNPEVLGLERDTPLERGVSIINGYRLCKGKHWQEQEWDE